MKQKEDMLFFGLFSSFGTKKFFENFLPWKFLNPHIYGQIFMIVGFLGWIFLLCTLFTLKFSSENQCFMVDINWCKSHLVFINFSFQNTTIFQKIFNFYLVVEKALIAKHVQNFLLIFAIQGFKIIVFIQSIWTEMASCFS